MSIFDAYPAHGLELGCSRKPLFNRKIYNFDRSTYITASLFKKAFMSFRFQLIMHKKLVIEVVGIIVY